MQTTNSLLDAQERALSGRVLRVDLDGSLLATDPLLHDSSLSAWSRLLRIHQWAKNLLLFVPLVTAHRLAESPLVAASLIAFLAFSLGASSIYIVNDLMDLTSDRLHPRKRYRPIASGRISIRAALTASVLLLAASIALAAFRPAFLQMLLLYLGVSLAYTFRFKKSLIVDVLCLAGLYTLRILAGGAVTDISISTWLIAFSMFLFLSLAFVKRYTELDAHRGSRGDLIHGRGYCAIDLDMVRSVGPASGYISALVICLYLHDRESIAMYRHPNLLLLIGPVVLYWISWVWFLAQRGQMHSDPVVFALRDRKSLMAGASARRSSPRRPGFDGSPVGDGRSSRLGLKAAGLS